MADIIYRIPDISELEDLCRLNDYLFELSSNKFTNSFNPDWQKSPSYKQFFAQYFDKVSKYILVAYASEKMVGYASGSIDPAPEFRLPMLIAEMENLMVLEDYQHLGIGLELANRFEQWAKSNEARKLRVSVFSRNTKALNFYKRFGFADYDVNLEKDI